MGGLRVEKSGDVFLLGRDVDDVLQELEMGGPEPVEFGFDVQFFKIHGFFIQNPGAGQVEILEAAASKADTVFNSQIYLIQVLLKRIEVCENPMVLQADL